MPIFRPEYIIMHDSLTKDGETVSWGAIRKFHMEVHGWADIGYHMGIELVGNTYEVFLGRMVGEPGAHCLGYNQKSIGICLIGNFEEDKPHAQQWYKAVDLVAHLSWLYEIPNNKIGGHKEFDTTRTCPHQHFDCDRFREDVQTAQSQLISRKAKDLLNYLDQKKKSEGEDKWK